MNKQALDHSLDFIKSWLRFRYEQGDTPGFVVAISYKGKPLFNEAFGFANLENKMPLTTDHVFRIASHSKTFTATALMQLQERGKLRLDDYAADHLPWLKKHTDKRWLKVTLRQLMSHGAGVIRDGLDSDYWQLERPFPGKSELQKELLGTDLIIDANVKLKYSNYGYSLLGMVIEEASGITYHDYVTQHIIRPLGLSHTGPEYTKDTDEQFVTGYTNAIDNTRLPIANTATNAMAAATGFYSTAQELCAYFAAHSVGTGKLLSDESKKEMQRAHFHAYMPGQDISVDYGLGFDIEYLGRHKTIGHGGGFPGQSTKSIADPKNELVVVALTNCISGPSRAIARGIYSIIDYFQDNTPTGKAKHDLERLEGRYMNLWGINDIVVTGDKVVAAYPSWQPLSNPGELEYIDDTTFRIMNVDSFDAESELVRFTIKNNKVTTLKYGGATMWPEEEWVKKQKRRKIVSSPGQ